MAAASYESYAFHRGGHGATVDLGRADTDGYRLNLVQVNQGGLVVDGLRRIT
jgi:hypothetical protein